MKPSEPRPLQQHHLLMPMIPNSSIANNNSINTSSTQNNLSTQQPFKQLFDHQFERHNPPLIESTNHQSHIQTVSNLSQIPPSLTSGAQITQNYLESQNNNLPQNSLSQKQQQQLKQQHNNLPPASKVQIPQSQSNIFDFHSDNFRTSTIYAQFLQQQQQQQQQQLVQQQQQLNSILPFEDPRILQITTASAANASTGATQSQQTPTTSFQIASMNSFAEHNNSNFVGTQQTNLMFQTQKKNQQNQQQSQQQAINSMIRFPNSTTGIPSQGSTQALPLSSTISYSHSHQQQQQQQQLSQNKPQSFEEAKSSIEEIEDESKQKIQYNFQQTQNLILQQQQHQPIQFSNSQLNSHFMPAASLNVSSANLNNLSQLNPSSNSLNTSSSANLINNHNGSNIINPQSNFASLQLSEIPIHMIEQSNIIEPNQTIVAGSAHIHIHNEFEAEQKNSVNNNPIQFQCLQPECEGKVFKSQILLHEHTQLAHTMSQVFTCPEQGCGKQFNQLSSFQKHCKSHGGSRPYKCTFPECDYAFTQISNLKRHMKVHLNDKPYECEYCLKTFTTASNLKQHQLTHENQVQRERFICPVPDCGKSYLYSSSLKKHQKEHLFNNLQSQILSQGIQQQQSSQLQQSTHQQPLNQRHQKQQSSQQHHHVIQNNIYSEEEEDEEDEYCGENERIEVEIHQEIPQIVQLIDDLNNRNKILNIEESCHEPRNESSKIITQSDAMYSASIQKSTSVVAPPQDISSHSQNIFQHPLQHQQKPSSGYSKSIPNEPLPFMIQPQKSAKFPSGEFRKPQPLSTLATRSGISQPALRVNTEELALLGSFFATQQQLAIQHDNHFDVLLNGYLYSMNKSTGKLEIHDVQTIDEIAEGVCVPLSDTTHHSHEEIGKKLNEIEYRYQYSNVLETACSALSCNSTGGTAGCGCGEPPSNSAGEIPSVTSGCGCGCSCSQQSAQAKSKERSIDTCAKENQISSCCGNQSKEQQVPQSKPSNCCSTKSTKANPIKTEDICTQQNQLPEKKCCGNKKEVSLTVPPPPTTTTTKSHSLNQQKQVPLVISAQTTASNSSKCCGSKSSNEKSAEPKPNSGCCSTKSKGTSCCGSKEKSTNSSNSTENQDYCCGAPMIKRFENLKMEDKLLSQVKLECTCGCEQNCLSCKGLPPDDDDDNGNTIPQPNSNPPQTSKKTGCCSTPTQLISQPEESQLASKPNKHPESQQNHNQLFSSPPNFAQSNNNNNNNNSNGIFDQNLPQKQHVQQKQIRCLCSETQDMKHKHGPDCGHTNIIHNGHIDYLVNNQLHHPHGNHCDYHGTVTLLDSLPIE